MRNLKKVLALVLALVMVLGLMTVATSAKEFDDQASVTAAYDEAVQVLGGLKVFQGKNVADTFAPADTITRAEVAAIIYRLVTGDVDDKQASIYAGYADFADVKAKPEGYWASGYIGYCANAQYIMGDLVNFYPDNAVTGYEALAMILRAVGYDQNKEFQGSGWQVRVASTARERGVLKNVTESQLVGAASREMVAELLFQASRIAKVTYTSALGYNKYKTTLVTANSEENDSLAFEAFNLVAKDNQRDSWGNPCKKWTVTKPVALSKSGAATTIATIVEKTIEGGELTVASKECDVFELYEKAGEVKATDDAVIAELYVNGDYDAKDGRNATADVDPVTTSYRVQATDITTLVGGQGRLTKLYPSKYAEDGVTLVHGPIVTMVDTWLARVKDVKAHTEDPATHTITDSYVILTVYTTAEGTDIKVTNGSTDYTYNRGDMLLVTTNQMDRDLRTTQAKLEASAYSTDPLAANITTKLNAGLTISGAAEYVTGQQNVIYYNQNKHDVNGTVVTDALTLNLVAGTGLATTYAWYKDAYGNLIGIGDAPLSANVGVITSLQYDLNTTNATASTDGSGVVRAGVLLADGTTTTLSLRMMLVQTNDGDIKPGTAGDPMTTDAEKSATLKFLLPEGDTNVAMFVADDDDIKINVTGEGGWLYVSPLTINNAVGTKAGTLDLIATTSAVVGDGNVSQGHLWKFVSNNDDTWYAIEVAGDPDNTDPYKDNNNSASADGDEIAKGAAATALDSADKLYFDKNSVFMVQNPDTGKITVINGPANMTGKIVLADGAEVDWTVGADGYVDVAYMQGSVTGALTNNLFFMQAASEWHGSTTDGTGYGTLYGYVDTEYKALTLPAGADNSGYDAFMEIKSDFAPFAGGEDDTAFEDEHFYGPHLYALELDGDVIVSMFYDDDDAGEANALRFVAPSVEEADDPDDNVSAYTDGKAAITEDASDPSAYGGLKAALDKGGHIGTGTTFKTGVEGGNRYSDKIHVISYQGWHSKGGADLADNEKIRLSTDGLTLYTESGDTAGFDTDDTVVAKVIPGFTKIVGGGLEDALDPNTVARSYVTIVYDVTTDVAYQIYLTTVKITPVTGVGVALAEPDTDSLTKVTNAGLEQDQMMALMSKDGEVYWFTKSKLVAGDKPDADQILNVPYTNTESSKILYTITNDDTGKVYWSEQTTGNVSAERHYFRFNIIGWQGEGTDKPTIYEAMPAGDYTISIYNLTAKKVIETATFTLG